MPSKRDIQQRLASVPLFRSCSRREISLLAGIAEEIVYEAGSTIFKEGDEGLGLFVIVQGSVSVEFAGGRGRQTIGEGSFFGEISLMDGGPRSATVTAREPTRVLHVPAWSFNAVLKENAVLATKLLREACGRLRAALQTMRDNAAFL